MAATDPGTRSVRRRRRTPILQMISTAMTTMPQDLRETVALVLGEEMTHRQAAEVLDLSEGTISWRMSEVKKTLREIARKEEML